MILFFCATSNAQKKPDPKEIDTKTYVLYSAGKWDELTEVCEDAIDNGIDFFYLRLRAGIAYYNNANYMSAIGHFEKAMKYNPTDITTMEYLYYSYLFSGRESDVLSLISIMPFKLKKKLRVYSKFIYGAYTEGGYTFNNDFSNQKKKGSAIQSNNYNEQSVANNQSYINLSLRHQLGKNIKIFHGYNNISVSSTKQIFEQSQGQKSFDMKTTQDEYYLNVNFNLGGGFDLVTAFHYLNVKYEDINTDVNTSVNPSVTTYSLTKNTLNDFVALISLTMNTGHFKLGLKNSISNLNQATQVQNTAQVIFYPLGNLNLYTITDATLFSDRVWGSKFKNFGILNQLIGWKVFAHLWMETGYTLGNIYNYNESDAFLVFNNVDKISNRISLNLISPVSSHIELSLRYQYYNQEVATYFYSNSSNINTNITNNTNHKIIGGLKWTF
ncbi:MAG: hypothetical protein WC358_06040 [Ignavibacteria bacterium]|jgi:tetratricopeptide (TPR) repeat protein